MVLLAYIPAASKVRAEEWQILGLSRLYSKFKVSLGNLIRFCLKIKSKKMAGIIAEW